jgi:hypothetical protein
MTNADQTRACPTPVEPDDEPDECPECGSTTFNHQEDYTDYHGCRLSLGPIWRCTDCKWAVRAL